MRPARRERRPSGRCGRMQRQPSGICGLDRRRQGPGRRSVPYPAWPRARPARRGICGGYRLGVLNRDCPRQRRGRRLCWPCGRIVRCHANESGDRARRRRCLRGTLVRRNWLIAARQARKTPFSFTACVSSQTASERSWSGTSRARGVGSRRWRRGCRAFQMPRPTGSPRHPSPWPGTRQP